jgi:5'(3')-deoxyribonucleotidase
MTRIERIIEILNQGDPDFKIFLDMDGVLVDLVRTILGKLSMGRAIPFILKNWPRGVFSIKDALELEKDPLLSLSVDDWSTAAETDFAADLVRLCTDLVGIENLFILTSPGSYVCAGTGKMEWMNRHFPELTKNMIVTRHKYLIRGPGILIDDKQETVDSINSDNKTSLKAGLCPQPWNEYWHIRPEDKLTVITEGILAGLMEKPGKFEGEF